MNDLCGISATPGRGNEEISVETRFRGQCRLQSRNPYGPVLGYRSRLLGFHRSLGSAYLYYPCSVRHSNRLSLIGWGVDSVTAEEKAALIKGASELLHIGQAVMALGGKLEYFVDTVFNYPTLAECYKVAAFNGLNRVSKFD